MITLEFERWIDAPSDAAWAVVSDVVGYADFAPNLSKIEILEGSGQGMQRRCWDTQGNHWDETCSLWDEGRQYAMRVHTEAEDYPLPFKSLQGMWHVEAKDDGSLIKMRFDMEPKYGVVGRTMLRVMQGRFRQVGEELLDNWQAAIIERAAV